ncbi:hypothetical protein, partial [Butyrivibrio sp. XPD2002]|uniref:hypothetical protein n=1 Tax=Butyrivibrio sp. XPD2002 TaxID=1280665 RepID=UPI000565B999
MKSRNEEYLDGLLQALKKDSNSGIAKTSSGTDFAETVDLDDAIEVSSNNSDLKEIGEMLGKLDSGELMDTGMNRVLKAISAPDDKSLPKYKIGDDVPEGYEKDADELALDEAIARAEAMELEASKKSAAEESLMEVAPEILIEDDANASGESAEADPTKAILDDMVPVTPEEEMGTDNSSAEIALDNLDLPGIESTEPISEEMLDIDGMLDSMDNPEKILDDDSAELKAAIGEGARTAPENIVVDDLQIPDAVVPEAEEPAPEEAMSIEDIDKMMAELGAMTDEVQPGVEETPVAEMHATETGSEEMSPADIEKMMAEMGMAAEAEQPVAEETPAVEIPV